MDRWNVAEFCEAQLLDRFGFVVSTSVTAASMKKGGNYERRIDSQHAVLVRFSPFNRGKGKGLSASYSVKLARRDINDMRVELENDKLHSWSGTVGESPTDHFLGRPRTTFDAARGATRHEVADYLEQWIPPLDELANLSFIEQQVETVNKRTGLAARRFIRIPNRMLWGWREEDEYLIEQELAEVRELEHGGPVRSEGEARVERYRAWIGEHPDGLQREEAG